MKKSLFQITMIIPVILLLCFTFSCQQQVEEGITEEEAKAFIDGLMEVWNEGNLALVDELLAPDSRPGLDVATLKEWVPDMRITYPDLNLTTEEIIVKDDKIVWRWTFTGTNTGPIGDIPPTGKKVQVSGVSIFRVVNGKSVASWMYYDEMTQLRQLGYTITPPQPSEEK